MQVYALDHNSHMLYMFLSVQVSNPYEICVVKASVVSSLSLILSHSLGIFRKDDPRWVIAITLNDRFRFFHLFSERVGGDVERLRNRQRAR